MLAAVAGDYPVSTFQRKDPVWPSWWFCDNRDGMERQMKALGNQGMLSVFVGMLTDSRSFLSFPRHEYFKILCNLIGEWVEAGEVPCEWDLLKEMVEGICYNNIDRYMKR